jgi:hypothetical protein
MREMDPGNPKPTQRFRIRRTTSTKPLVGRDRARLNSGQSAVKNNRTAAESRKRVRSIFISYSHKDSVWLEWLLTFLKPYVQQGSVALWADPLIQVGDGWQREIKRAVERAAVGVLLVSQDFLASDFITQEELPALTAAADRNQLALACIPIGFSTYKATQLADFQWVRDPEQPLERLRKPDRHLALVQIVERIVALAIERRAPPIASPPVIRKPRTTLASRRPPKANKPANTFPRRRRSTIETPPRNRRSAASRHQLATKRLSVRRVPHHLCGTACDSSVKESRSRRRELSPGPRSRSHSRGC